MERRVLNNLNKFISHYIETAALGPPFLFASTDAFSTAGVRPVVCILCTLKLAVWVSDTICTGRFQNMLSADINTHGIFTTKNEGAGQGQAQAHHPQIAAKY